MKKVVAFLEKYAEWVALGVACLFLLFVVYSYVVSPDQLHAKVGSDTVLPGDVDPAVNKTVATLAGEIEAPAVGVQRPTPDYGKQFAEAIGPQRKGMTPEVIAGGQPIRPLLPGEERTVVVANQEKERIADLPKVPTPAISDVGIGSSLVMAPPPLPDPDADPNAAPPPPPPDDPAALLASALDKRWITVEAKFDTKAFADEWKRVFFNKNKPLPQLPPQVFLTHFLQLEVEREELVGPDQWGNKVTLQPLPLVPTEPYPKDGDREGQEKYRIWAEQHQVDIVEPQFFRVLDGDPWFVPSMALEHEKELAAAQATEPFDPANPNIPFEKMTPQQKQQVYLYKQSVQAEKQKQDAAARRSKMDATRPPPSDGGGRSGGGGGRRIGGYAPLPIQLAEGPGVTPGRQPFPGGGRGGYNRDGMGRIIPPDGNAAGRRRGYYPPATPGTPGSAQPQLNPDGQVQNPALTAPFDPTRLLDYKGNAAEILMWAHDDTTEPGKTYRYRLRVKLKNSLYNTFGLTATPEMAAQFALQSDWSPWKEVVAPRTTEVYYATYSAKLGTTPGAKREINSVTAEIFKHERGKWTSEKFVVTPGDVIGGVKNGVDYATGTTLVDLRPNVRDQDLRIMVADQSGNVSNVDYQAQLKDKNYKNLTDKVKSQTINNANNGGGPAASLNGVRGNPALINEVGAR